MSSSSRSRWSPYVSFESWINLWFDTADGNKAVTGFLVLFVAVWTSFQILSYMSIGLHGDLIEAFSWSQQLAPGYKHPPLTAIIVAAWFSAFPIADWAFHLLAMVNAATAFLAIDLIARRWLDGDKRLLVPLLLLLTPFYQFHGQRFGTNQVLLSTWPIATYCFLRSFETRTVIWSVAAGVTAALAMLGKYYSVVLIAAFVTAGLIDPRRYAYLKSPAPWVAALAGLLVLTPHLHWLLTTGGQTFAYAYSTHGSANAGVLFLKLVNYCIGALGYVALPIITYLFMVRPDRRILAATFWPSDSNRRMLVTLQAGLLLFPLLISPLIGIELTPLWTMSAWFLLPVILLAPIEARVLRPDAVRVAAALFIISIAVLAVSPVVAWVRFTREQATPGRAHYRAVSRELTRAWRHATNQPLRIVTGESGLAHAVTFYSEDHPVHWALGNTGLATWIDDQRLKREGWVGVCTVTAITCTEFIVRSAGGAPVIRTEFEHSASFLGRTGRPLRFVFFIVPPMQIYKSALSGSPRL